MNKKNIEKRLYTTRVIKPIFSDDGCMIPKRVPITIQRKVNGEKKSFILFGTTIIKSEVEPIKRKAMGEFRVVKVIDATTKQRAGKPDPVKQFAIIVRERK